MVSARRAITILVILIALILTGTVIVLSTVVQYFGVDSRDVIQEGEMRLYERLAAQAAAERASTGREGQQVVHSGDRAKAASGASERTSAAVGEDGGEDSSVKELLNRLDERGWFSGNETSATEALVRASLAAGQTLQPRIPKIIHATWKTDTVPKKWAGYRQVCMDMHPDYEFKLWSDEASREFIAEHYPWFLSTFDGYTYPIQRADVIRYFVLHHYGGVYMDLDIGCRRPLDPLMYFQVILPATIPVGVSNDLMFSEKGHPFMDLVIHNLITFDHTYGTNYPTVMFSTGPMFLSAQYGLWPKDVAEGVERQVRVLPRRWYGKNAPDSQMEDSYFDHFYGSSWHADDAGFITFLGKFGMALMYAGLLIVVVGVLRLIWAKRFAIKAAPRSIGPIALPYEALPFTRPGTPGSRPGSPTGSRSGTPAGPRPSVPPSRGGLFYLPVWLMPSGEGRSPGGRSPSESQGNWSQYFSNLSFVEDGENRYHPVPNFSRPPSPSNNSILHAPGSTHDGAFDGTPLHSIHAPKATQPALPRTSIESNSSSFSTSPLPNNPPLSPNPPAYSALRSWGTSLFRGFPTSPGQQHSVLPVSVNDTTGNASTVSDAAAASSRKGGHVPSLSLSQQRPRSPAPPAYAAARPTSPPVADARSRSPGAGFLGLSGVGGAPAAAASAAARDGAEFQGAAHPSFDVDLERGRQSLEVPGELECAPSPLSPRLAGSAGSSRPASRSGSHSRRGSAVGGMGIGGKVEEEVDRLLSEMAPEDFDKTG
ncbi:hypothetical protein JCM8547_008506 [Rhodosporidiobolus lusitaniae]